MNRLALGALALSALAWVGCGHTCAPDNCSGCCDASGVCQPGNQAADCGTLGNTCATCNVGQTCNAIGVCSSPGGNTNGNGSGNSTTTSSGNGSTNVTTTGTTGTTSTTGVTTSNTTATTGTTGFTTGTSSTTGSTTGSNTVNGTGAFTVQGALGEVHGGVVAWALSDSPLTCPMLYGDAGLNAQVVVGVTFTGGPGTFDLSGAISDFDGGAVLEEGQVISGIINNPYVATSGFIDYSSIGPTQITGSYQATLAQDGGGFVQVLGNFDVPVCP